MFSPLTTSVLLKVSPRSFRPPFGLFKTESSVPPPLKFLFLHRYDRFYGLPSSTPNLCRYFK